MIINRGHGYGEAKLFNMIVLLFLALTPWMGALSQGQELSAADTHQHGRKKVYVAVQQGRLTVDLREADVAEVLGRIERETGIPIFFVPSSEKRIGANFANVELDEGLRRILRLASLNHIILYTYTDEPSGGVAIEEVRVFGEERQGISPQPIVAERNDEGSSEDPGQRFAAVFATAQATTLPSPRLEASEVTHRFQEILQSLGQEVASSLTPNNAADGSEQQSEEPTEAEDLQQ